jgi:hypothetical protein
MVYLGLYGFAWTDYDFEVTPSLDALRAGHILRFFELVPAYGGSIELRAPFALLPGLWGGGEQSVFQAVSIPCLVAGALLGVWLCARLRTLGANRLARATALALCAANPITVYACEQGHPEELLGAVLCVAAVLVAQRSRYVSAGVLLGLAIVNKEWGLLAIGPVLVALPERRWRALAIAGAIAILFYAPFMLLQVGGSGGVSVLAASTSGVIFQPWQWWWFLADHSQLVRDSQGIILYGYRAAPQWLAGIPHPLIIAIELPLTLLAVRRGRARTRHGGSAVDPLLLLVFLLLLRCVLDPWDTGYYPLPFLIALTTWEALRFRRAPLFALAASFATWAVFYYPGPSTRPDLIAASFMAMTVPAVAALAYAIYHTRPLRIGARRRLGASRAKPAAIATQLGD